MSFNFLGGYFVFDDQRYVQPDESRWEMSCYFEIVEWTMGRLFSFFKSCSLEILLPCQLWSTIDHIEHNWAELSTMPFYSRLGEQRLGLLLHLSCFQLSIN